MRLECQQLFSDNVKLKEEFKQLKQMTNPKKYLELQKEVEQLHWQLNKMENSRKLYELATGQLVTFLEQVSTSLSTSASRGSQSTINDVGAVSTENLLQAKRLSLASLDMVRSQSMPGLADNLLLTLPKTRRLSARDKKTRRNSSVSKTRVSSASPLPSLAETEDTGHTGVTDHTPQPRSASDDQSNDSFPLFTRGPGSHVTDPLCMSTPKSYKMSRVKPGVKETCDLRPVTSDLEDTVSVNKRGTLTSLSSGSSSSASPPSSSETSGGDQGISSGDSLSRFRHRGSQVSRSGVSGVSGAQHIRSVSR